MTWRSGRRPVLFVLDHDLRSLTALLSALARRLGNDFTVAGESSPQAALDALGEMAATSERVALLMVDDLCL